MFTKDTPDDASDSVLSVTFRGMKTDVLISSVSLVFKCALILNKC